MITENGGRIEYSNLNNCVLVLIPYLNKALC